MSATATLETLRAQEELFAEAYQQHLKGTQAIQQTLIQYILPGLVDELGLQEEDEKRARLWLGDLRTLWVRLAALPYPLTQPSTHKSRSSGYSGCELSLLTHQPHVLSYYPLASQVHRSLRP